MKDDFFIWAVMEQIYSAAQLGLPEVSIADPTQEELDVFKDYGVLSPQKDGSWKLKIYPSHSSDKEKSGE